MPLLRQRSYQKELLDRNDIPFEDIKRNMQELDFINRKLGGHDITLDGIIDLIKNQMNFNSKLSIVEIGSGGGDNLRAIRNWAERIHLPVQLKLRMPASRKIVFHSFRVNPLCTERGASFFTR
jgi:hypothetical protein